MMYIVLACLLNIEISYELRSTWQYIIHVILETWPGPSVRPWTPLLILTRPGSSRVTQPGTHARLLSLIPPSVGRLE